MDGNASYRNNYFVSVCLSRLFHFTAAFLHPSHSLRRFFRFTADNLLPGHSLNGAAGLFSHQKFLMAARALDKTTS